MVVPNAVFADTTVIQNSVSVSASSGGNVAESGQVIEGGTSVDVSSQTVINGETVQSVEKHIDNPNEPITEDLHYATSGVDVETHIDASASGVDMMNMASDSPAVELYGHEDMEGTSSASTSEANMPQSERSFSETISIFIKNMVSYVLSFFR